MISRRRFLRVSMATLGLGTGVGFYTWRVEPHWLEIVERSLPIAALPTDLAGARLAQLSDLHIGRGVGHLLSVRFNVRPEITVFRLEPA